MQSAFFQKQLFRPFAGTPIPKDAIAYPTTLSGPAYSSFAQGFPYGKGALENCCWIEAMSHVLLSDPFIRHFVFPVEKQRRRLDEIEKLKLQSALFKEEWPPTKLYELGLHLENMLIARRDSGVEEMKKLMQTFRDNDLVKQVDTHIVQNGGMSIAPDMIPLCIAALHTVLSLNNWGGSFQALWRTHGCCFDELIDSECISEETRTTKAECQFEFTIPLQGNETISLQSAILRGSESYPGINKWKVSGEKHSCGQSLLTRRRLLTLPWMLYVRVDVGEKEQLKKEGKVAGILEFDPDRLILGPTKDMQFAEYKLVSRVLYTRSHLYTLGHYTADVREQMHEPTFKNHNFERRTEIKLTGTVRTTDTVYMTWLRVK